MTANQYTISWEIIVPSRRDNASKQSEASEQVGNDVDKPSRGFGPDVTARDRQHSDPGQRDYEPDPS